MHLQARVKYFHWNVIRMCSLKYVDDLVIVFYDLVSQLQQQQQQHWHANWLRELGFCANGESNSSSVSSSQPS